MHLLVLYNVGKFQNPSSNTFQDTNYFLVNYFLVNYFLVIFGPVQTTDRLQTESDAYAPTVQWHRWAQ